MSDALAGPDERTFRDHLERPAFRAGVSRGRWHVVEIDWPWVVIAMAAANRDSSPSEFTLKFELTNYPTSGPTAGLWDSAANTYLAREKRPKGRRQTLAFRADWERGEALYLPIDRRAIAGHDGWLAQARGSFWSAESDITSYLLVVADLLTADDYEGI